VADGTSDPDLYSTLGVPRGAARDEIKKAYRKLARELHPDRRPDDPESEERFKRVSYAYQVLNDPEKRKLYDEFGSIALKEGFDPNAYRQWHQRARGAGWNGRLEDLLEHMQRGGGNVGLEDLFGGRIDDVIGGRRRRRSRRSPRRGRDLEASLTVSFNEALEGTERELTVSAPGVAPRTLKTRVPAGVRDGEKLLLRGRGGPAPGRGEPGDLVLTVSVGEHPWFWREGDDLHLRLPVTASEAYGGARVRVPTPRGEVALSIPAGTQSGAKLRLRGRGVARRGRSDAGDLFAHVEVQLPAPGNERVRKLLEEVDAALEEDVRGELKL